MTKGELAVQDLVSLHLQIVAEERTACAELVRAAGCICRKFRSRAVYDTTDPLYGYGDEDGGPRILIHDPRCPEALSLAIEARGKE